MMKHTVHKLTLAIMTGALAVAGAFAQDTSATQTTPAAPPAVQHRARRHGGDPVAARLANLSRRLNLTDDQKAKLTPILQDERSQVQQIRKDTSLTPQQKRDNIVQLHKTTRGLISGVLTPEQQARFNQPPAVNSVEWMSTRLNLTADQKAKVTELFNSQHQQIQALQQDSSLTPQQKQAKVREIRQATHQQVVSLLTPEQAEKMGQMRGYMRGRHGRRAAPPQAQPTPAPAPNPGF